MTRLPTPGSDNGTWGDILNDFLEVEHNADGSLKKAGDIADAKTKANAAVPASQLGVADGVAQLDSDSKLKSSQVPANLIAKSDDSDDAGKAIDAYTGGPLDLGQSGAGFPTAIQGNLGASHGLDLDVDSAGFVGTLNADCAISFTNVQAGADWTVMLIQDGSGGHLVTWDSVTWVTGSGAVTPGASSVSVFQFASPDGVIVYGFQSSVPRFSRGVPGQVQSVFEPIPRLLATAARTLATGELDLIHFIPDRDIVITNITTACIGTVASGLTLARLGIFSYDGGDAYTTLGRTTSDTALWATQIPYTKPITSDGSGGTISSVTCRAGKEYAWGILAVGSQMPQLAGSGVSNGSGFLGMVGNLPRINRRLTGQADIGASVTAPSASGNIVWAALT